MPCRFESTSGHWAVGDPELVTHPQLFVRKAIENLTHLNHGAIKAMDLPSGRELIIIIIIIIIIFYYYYRKF